MDPEDLHLLEQRLRQETPSRVVRSRPQSRQVAEPCEGLTGLDDLRGCLGLGLFRVETGGCLP
jgi:hypothetical protein